MHFHNNHTKKKCFIVKVAELPSISIRRSARLTSTTETGVVDGTVDGGGTTQPRTAATIRAERMVLDRLAPEARPSLAEALDSFDEFDETGGSTGTGVDDKGWTTIHPVGEHDGDGRR